MRRLVCVVAAVVGLVPGPVGASAELVYYDAPVPCGPACPYWQPVCDFQGLCLEAVWSAERACLPAPPAPPGSFADVRRVVPESAVTAYLGLDARFSDWVALICRTAPGADGSYLLGADGHTWPPACFPGYFCTPVGTEGRVSELRGQEIVFRALNGAGLLGTSGFIWFE